MRPLLMLLIFVALAGRALAAGGIVFYTPQGVSYVTAIQYETLSTPTAHLAFVTVKGGKRMQIGASNIVADIPFPDAARSYSASEIEATIARCEMIGSLHPKYAASLQQVAALWRRQSTALAQSKPTPAPRPAASVAATSAKVPVPPAAQPPPADSPQPPTASTGPSGKTGLPISTSYVKQLADALVSVHPTELADILRQSPPAMYAQAHSDLVALLATESKIKTELKRAADSHARIVVEADRIKRNADVTDSPNLLRPDDRSAQQRAQRDRANAKEMVESSVRSVEKLKQSCADLLNINFSTVEALVKSGDYEIALALSKRITGFNAEIQPSTPYSNRAGNQSHVETIAVKLAEAQLVLADVESAMSKKDLKSALSSITNKYGNSPEYRPLRQKAEFLTDLLSSNSETPAKVAPVDTGGLILQTMHITRPI